MFITPNYKVKTAHALNNVLIFSKFEILQTFLTKYQFRRTLEQYGKLILVRKITNLTGSEDTEESVLVFPTGCTAFTQVFR